MELLHDAIVLSLLAIAYIVVTMMVRIPRSLDKVKTVDIPCQTIITPQITIVFQAEIDDDEDLCKEIADMYLSNRAFYYSGKNSMHESLLSEKEPDVFVSFENVDFSKLQKIEV